MAYIAKNTKNLILVRGVSGSGKSTFAEEFLFPISLLISTDDFFMVNGEYQFNPELLPENHLKCIKSVESEMEHPQQDICPNIVVHNTFTKAWEIEPYKELADKLSSCRFVALHPNPTNKSSNQKYAPSYLGLQR